MAGITTTGKNDACSTNEQQMYEEQNKDKVNADKKLEYLMRGAVLKCTDGSHPRKLNLPQSHGVYISDHPMVHSDDCVVGDSKNIRTFGICNKGCPGQEISLAPHVEPGQQATGGCITGKECRPEIIGKWMNTYETTKIDGNGSLCSAVTMQSFLVCKYGGRIEPQTSGIDTKD